MEQVFLDTAGWAFAYPLARAAGCRVVSYTHYPTVSADMLVQVNPQSYLADMLLLEGVKRCLQVPDECEYGTTLDVIGPENCRLLTAHGLRGLLHLTWLNPTIQIHCLKSLSKSRLGWAATCSMGLAGAQRGGEV